MVRSRQRQRLAPKGEWPPGGDHHGGGHQEEEVDRQQRRTTGFVQRGSSSESQRGSTSRGGAGKELFQRSVRGSNGSTVLPEEVNKGRHPMDGGGRCCIRGKHCRHNGQHRSTTSQGGGNHMAGNKPHDGRMEGGGNRPPPSIRTVAGGKIQSSSCRNCETSGNRRDRTRHRQCSSSRNEQEGDSRSGSNRRRKEWRPRPRHIWREC